MRIVKETSDLMIIKDRNIMGFLFSLVFVSIGFLIILSPDFLNANPPQMLGVPFFLIGLLLIFSFKRYSITIDKGVNKISITWRKLIGHGKDEYDLTLINQLEFHTSYDSEQLLFILKDGEEIVLPSRGVMRVMGKKVSSLERIGGKVADFLDIKFIKIRSKPLIKPLSTAQETIREKRNKKDQEESSYEKRDI